MAPILNMIPRALRQPATHRPSTINSMAISAMHMAWIRQVCERLESPYRYSNSLVYSNYSWPPAVTDKQRAAVEAAAKAVLDARAQ
jgi:hypothetical protein